MRHQSDLLGEFKQREIVNGLPFVSNGVPAGCYEPYSGFLTLLASVCTARRACEAFTVNLFAGNSGAVQRCLHHDDELVRTADGGTCRPLGRQRMMLGGHRAGWRT